MVNRPFKCPFCHAAFKGEGGMNWHIMHQHEIQKAVDTIGNKYEVKINKLSEENTLLAQKLQMTELELQKAFVDLAKEQAEKALNSAEFIKLSKELTKAGLAIVIRDQIIKKELNIELPNPFTD